MAIKLAGRLLNNAIVYYYYFSVNGNAKIINILGLRVQRNPILIQTLRDYGYVEHMGLGVRKKALRGGFT